MKKDSYHGKMSASILINRVGALICRLWSIRILRYLVVGGVNAVFGYGVFALFILMQLHYVLAALLANICMILFSFNTIGILVFKNKDKRLVLRFFGVYMLAYLLNIGLLKVFDLYGVSSLIAGAIITLPMAALGFILNNKFVFNCLNK